MSTTPFLLEDDRMLIAGDTLERSDDAVYRRPLSPTAERNSVKLLDYEIDTILVHQRRSVYEDPLDTPTTVGRSRVNTCVFVNQSRR